MKYKILAFFGKSGAGKDYSLKNMIRLNKDFNRIISNTTRPKRDREVEGVDYYFVTPEDFDKETYLETSSYNNWKYGTAMSSLSKNKINVGVFDLQGIANITSNEKLDVLPVYVTAPDKIRLERCLNREDNPNVIEICRRFLADEKEYSALTSFPKNTICINTYEDLLEMEKYKNFL